MKCLSVRQPWASLIIAGVKRCENRTWLVKHRGPLAIHAAAGIDGRGWHQVFDSVGVVPPDHSVTLDDGTELPPWRDLPRGKILGAVEVIDCVRWEDLPADLMADPLAIGPWCWVLADPRPLATPFRCPGRLGLWAPPAGLRLP